MFDEHFWVGVAFLLFFAVVFYFKVPAMVTKRLDERADKIRSELEEAQRLREEAQALFAEYQRKQRDALDTAEEIVRKAKEDSTRIREESEQALQAALERRTEMAEQKIRQEEQRATADVRRIAVDVAIEAARQVLSKEVSGKQAAALIDGSLDDLPKHLG